MNAIKIRENIYWVGAIDWHLRSFHGYNTQRGSTYNAYLILDEKITLIDTVKSGFEAEMLSRIASVIDPARIDIVISNHVEMDHSGAIPAIKKICPQAAVYTVGPAGAKGLTAHFGDLGYTPVKTGDSLSLGSRSLHFVSTPMLHWPDNMVSYCPEEKILFSNDAFGQHLATSERFDDETDLSIALAEAKKYYANIILCYGKQAASALKVVQGLDINLIAPSHGILWRSHIQDILSCYGQWSGNNPQGGALVVYDSMWHSTEKMAKTIAEAFGDAGISTRSYDLKSDHPSDIVPDLVNSRYIAVGSPTLNNQMLPTVAAFLCYLKGLSPKNRKALAFGSYGWSGQSIGYVEKDLLDCGFDLLTESAKQLYIPSQDQLDALYQKVRQAVEADQNSL